MKLKELEKFNPITIQCHDNPDADALASGFGLYTYFKKKGKHVRFIYAGKNRIRKKNLTMMVNKIGIPVTYLEDIPNGKYPEIEHTQKGWEIKGLLITVDCQYGAGNVTKLSAEYVAVIDHHQPETAESPLTEIQSNLGSCSTLVWHMMKEEGFIFEKEEHLGTALYYGLFSDTNQFSEIYSPLDMDMRDSLPFEKSLIHLFKNANLSLKEMEIAGIALIRHMYDENYHYAIIKLQPCDPNVLGLMSDFLLQVEEVETCIAYNEAEDGIKYSVRSCVKEVRANELAAFLAENIGSGGGHMEKAGGFILKRKYDRAYPKLHTEVYFSERMNLYFGGCRIIEAGSYDIDITKMKPYVRKKQPQGYVYAKEVMPVGTPITVRTLEGDVDMTVREDLILMIGVKGVIYPVKKEEFEKEHHTTEEVYDMDKYALPSDYIPTIRSRINGDYKEITKYAKVCIPTTEVSIYARELESRVKVFTLWDKEKYLLGNPGDFLLARKDNLQDIYAVERDLFFETYQEIKEK